MRAFTLLSVVFFLTTVSSVENNQTEGQPNSSISYAATLRKFTAYMGVGIKLNDETG